MSLRVAACSTPMPASMLLMRISPPGGETEALKRALFLQWYVSRELERASPGCSKWRWKRSVMCSNGSIRL